MTTSTCRDQETSFQCGKGQCGKIHLPVRAGLKIKSKPVTDEVLTMTKVQKINIEFLWKALKVRRNADYLLKCSEHATMFKQFVTRGQNKSLQDAINCYSYPGASASTYSLDLNLFSCIMLLHWHPSCIWYSLSFSCKWANDTTIKHPAAGGIEQITIIHHELRIPWK